MILVMVLIFSSLLLSSCQNRVESPGVNVDCESQPSKPQNYTDKEIGLFITNTWFWGKDCQSKLALQQKVG